MKIGQFVLLGVVGLWAGLALSSCALIHPPEPLSPEEAAARQAIQARAQGMRGGYEARTMPNAMHWPRL